MCYGLLRLGRLDEAVELLSPILESQAIRADEPWDNALELCLYRIAVYALIYAGRLGEAEEALTRAWALVVDEPTADAEATSHTGSPPYTSNKATPIAPSAAPPSLTPCPSSSAGPSLPMAGQHRRAGTGAAPGAERARRPRRSRRWMPSVYPANLYHETDFLQARAWAAAARPETCRAPRDQLEAAACLGEQIGDLTGATSALHGLARLGQVPPPWPPA